MLWNPTKINYLHWWTHRVTIVFFWLHTYIEPMYWLCTMQLEVSLGTWYIDRVIGLWGHVKIVILGPVRAVRSLHCVQYASYIVYHHSGFTYSSYMCATKPLWHISGISSLVCSRFMIHLPNSIFFHPSQTSNKYPFHKKILCTGGPWLARPQLVRILQ